MFIIHYLVINDLDYEEEMHIYKNQPQEGFFKMEKSPLIPGAHTQVPSHPPYKWLSLCQVLTQEDVYEGK